MAEKKQIDWETVELHYRAGVRSLKDIGGEYGVSDAGIIKRAHRDGWTRDLSAKIKAKADAKVSADAVSAGVSTLTRSAEKEIVEANAELQAGVRREQRKDIQRFRAVVANMLSELEAEPTLINVDSLRKLSETFKTLVAMEREAFGIDSRFEEQKVVVAIDQMDVARRVAFLLAQAAQGK